MATSTWSYLQNPFDNVTKRNLKRMLLMATDHFDKLRGAAQTNPQVQQWYTNELPHYQAFVNLYNKAHAQKNIYGMHTQEFEEQIRQLSSEKIKRWDIQIQTQYDDNSAKYKALLPNGRAPFQRGAYETRINEIETLYNALGHFPNLAHVQTEVSNFLQTIREGRSEQQAAEKQESDYSKMLEDARKVLAMAMHRIFGNLLALFAHDPEWVEGFYELKYLRAGSNSSDDTKDEGENTVKSSSAQLPANAQTVQLQGDILPEDEILIENIGETILEAWTTDDPNAAPPARTLLVSPQQSGSFVAKNICSGSPKALVLRNLDAETGKYEVYLLRNKTAAKT